ncbi:hypothetical protein [Actinacidiphila sp. bgisy144]|uniref:hypothetical protein n=1 Tax=Actinacidiphila sp. bgisy144 TaxID=3413791 RepID=UPI003EBD685D
MRKVAIVGCGGSGKSHVARELGMSLDAPVTHLDAAFYDDEWNTLPMNLGAGQLVADELDGSAGRLRGVEQERGDLRELRVGTVPRQLETRTR